VPVYFEDPKQAEAVSERACGQSIPELEGLSKDKTEGVLAMPFPKDYETQLVRSLRGLTQPSLHVQRTRVLGIIEHVKTIILNWTLKLEEEGILGEGITFSTQEKAKATSSPVSHVTNFYAPVGQSQVQHDSQGAVQIATGGDVTADSVYIGLVKELVPKVKDAVGKLGLDQSQADEIKSEVETIEAQSRSPKPKRSIIRSSFETIQRILENGAGGAAGQLLYEIGKLLGGG
jgi:hypothetical protein